MRREKTNKLVEVTIGGNIKKYYTSANKASYLLGIAPVSVRWAINHHNKLATRFGTEVTVAEVDGSDITWKEIDNYDI